MTMSGAYDEAVSQLPRLHAALSASQRALQAAQTHADAAARTLRLAADRCREHPADPTTGVHDIEQRMHARAAAAMAFEVARDALTAAVGTHQANEAALARHLASLSAIRGRAA
jgi:hypothetical protein